METAVSAPSPVDAAGSGRSNGVYGPPFPLTSSTRTCVLSAGVGTPRDFMAPDTCGGTVTASSGTLKPDIGPATSVRPGACLTSGVLPHLRFNYGYFTCVVLLVLSWGRVTDGLAPSPRSGGFRQRLCRSFVLNERKHNR